MTLPSPKALFEDGYLFGIAFTVSVFASVLAVAEERRTVRVRRATAAVLAVTTGVVFGLVKAAGMILENRYLALGMVRLAVTNSADIVASLCLAALAFFVVAVAVAVVLRPVARSERGQRVLSGVLPAAVVFAFGAVLLNRALPGGRSELESLAGFALWAVACCAAAVWPLGWLSQRLGALAMRLPLAVVAGGAALPVIALGIAILALPAPAAKRLNLVLVSIDTLRADHLGTYGYPRKTSPNLDRLAAEAVLFRNAIAQSPWTLPSHMSIFTALYPSRHGAVTLRSKLAPRFVTLGEILQEEGYTTVAVTDGLFLSPSFGLHGFHRLEYPDWQLREQLLRGIGHRRRRGGPPDPSLRPGSEPVGPHFPHNREVRLASGIVDKTVAFLRHRRASGPFFLFVHTYQVHCPYDPPREWDRFSDPGYRGGVDTTGMCEFDFAAIKSSMSPADFQRVIDKYDGEIAYIDDQLGRLFAELKAQGLYETSVIVVTSDHGENFADHPQFELGHGDSLFDPTQRVPLILKAPGLPAGATVDVPVESVDILPTVLDLLGIPLPEAVDGTTLRPTIATGTRERGFAHSETGNRAGLLRSIRSDRWKLICSAQDECELYDLVADPREQENLIAVRPDVAHELGLDLARWASEQDRRLKAVDDAEEVELDGALMEQMRALGYVE